MDYPVVIRPLTEDEGGGYIAVFPDLPGCMSDGETPEEALKNAQDALVEWMDTARAREGFEIPQPGARAGGEHSLAWSRFVRLTGTKVQLAEAAPKPRLLSRQ